MKKTHTGTQIVAKLRQADVLSRETKPIPGGRDAQSPASHEPAAECAKQSQFRGAQTSGRSEDGTREPMRAVRNKANFDCSGREVEAAETRDLKACERHGKSAYLNFAEERRKAE